MEDRTISFGDFKRVMRHAFSEQYVVDLTDYDQWCGFSDFLSFAWNCFDKEIPAEDERKSKLWAKQKMDKRLQEARHGTQGDSVDQGRRAHWSREHRERSVALPREHPARESGSQGCIRCGGGNDDDINTV